MRLRALVVAVLVLVLGAWTCAPTGGTSTGSGGGDVPISTTGLTALIEGEGWHYVGEAGEPAFTNSWTNAGTGLPKLAFRIREAGVVDVQGVVVGGATTSSIFTLPEGYRPTAESYLPAESHDLGGQHGAYLIVGTDGTFVAVFPAGGTIVVYAQVFLNPPAVA